VIKIEVNKLLTMLKPGLILDFFNSVQNQNYTNKKNKNKKNKLNSQKYLF